MENGGRRGRWSYSYASNSQWSAGASDSYLSSPMEEMDEDSDHSWGNVSPNQIQIHHYKCLQYILSRKR